MDSERLWKQIQVVAGKVRLVNIPSGFERFKTVRIRSPTRGAATQPFTSVTFTRSPDSGAGSPDGGGPLGALSAPPLRSLGVGRFHSAR